MKNMLEYLDMNEKILIPLSIIISAVIIGIAIIFFNNKSEEIEINNVASKKYIPYVNASMDNILGSSDADIFIIEYSDLECPFCKKYHNTTFRKLNEKYGENSSVSFVFRHLPITSIHPSSFDEAVALQCVKEVSGNESFFEFKNKIFKETKSDGNFSNKKLLEIASDLILEGDKYKECLGSQKIKDRVQKDIDDAINAEVNGTPTIFLQFKNGRPKEIKPEFGILNIIISSYLDKKNK